VQPPGSPNIRPIPRQNRVAPIPRRRSRQNMCRPRNLRPRAIECDRRIPTHRPGGTAYIHPRSRRRPCDRLATEPQPKNQQPCHRNIPNFPRPRDRPKYVT
jgi:hypothetical protein